MFRTKFLLAVLMTLLLSSLSADRTEAGWHHWGYGYYPYAYSYCAAVPPCCGEIPISWVVLQANFRASLGTIQVALRLRVLPAQLCVVWCRLLLGGVWGSGLLHRPAVLLWIHGGRVVQGHRSVGRARELGSGQGARVAGPAEQPTPAVPEPADTLPSLPAEPGFQLPELPDAGTTLPKSPRSAPVTPDSPDPALPLLPDDSALLRQPAGSATLALQVPSDARVFVNGMLTRTPGTYRQYVSRGLLPGHDYTYEVRVEVERNGRAYSDVRTVNLRAGGARELAFRMNQPLDLAASRRPVETTLTLRVPETARVTLEGHAIAATGEVRTFVTRELPDGERWDGYRVVVEIEQDGRVESSVKTIDLVGGGQHELSFDFAPSTSRCVRSLRATRCFAGWDSVPSRLGLRPDRVGSETQPTLVQSRCRWNWTSWSLPPILTMRNWAQPEPSCAARRKVFAWAFWI
jgi:uncharacterized protein (TIGR03000 family)